MAINDELINKTVRHQVMVQRFASGQARNVIPFLEQASEYLSARLAEEGLTIRNRTRLRNLLSDVRQNLTVYYNGYTEQLNLDLLEFAGYEAEFNAGTLDSVLVDFETVTPSDEQVIAAATLRPMNLNNQAVNMEQAISNWTPTEINRVNSVITSGFFEGRTTQQLTNEVNSIVNGITKNNAAAIARTSVNHVSAQAKNEVYNDNSDVLIGYRIIATLDMRTTDTCKFFDQRVVKLTDDYKPIPPFHYGCRTTTAPELDGRFSFLDEGGERASVGADGGEPVSAKTSYYQWLKTQPAAFQDEALGKTKGLIFRNAGLTTDEFKAAATNRMGQPLTIEEMAQKDQKIANYLDE